MTDALFDIEVPAYHVPGLAEMTAHDNGLTAVSTFSGCGGSSLGLKAAGWRIPYAVEFIPAARDTYLANFPDAFVDDRDVRLIQPGEILERIGLNRGDLDLFEGSPPCSSFSIANAGSTRFGAAKVKAYSEGVKQQTDDLFDEWLRLVEGLLPKAVIAENVPGLLRDDAQEFYWSILSRLRGLGYEVDGGLYNAMHFGAATSRERLVIRGVRRDLGIALPPPPRRLQHGYTAGDALAALPVPIPQAELEEMNAERYAIGREWHNVRVGESSEKYMQLVRCSPNRPLPGITAAAAHSGAANPMHWSECRRFTPTELGWIFGFPPDYRWPGTPGQAYERIARCVSPPMYTAHGRVLAQALGGR